MHSSSNKKKVDYRMSDVQSLEDVQLQTSASAASQDGELSDQELDEVSGGQKTTAESIAMNTNGVKTVKNDIIIRP